MMRVEECDALTRRNNFRNLTFCSHERIMLQADTFIVNFLADAFYTSV